MRVDVFEYGADADGRRGIMVAEPILEGTDEETSAITNQIVDAIFDDCLDDVHDFTAVLTDVEHRNVKFSREMDEHFYDEVEVDYDFEVSPIDYMDYVLPKVFKRVEDEAEVNGWTFHEFDVLLELEEKLIDADYQGEHLDTLTAIVEPYRIDWLKVYKEKEMKTVRDLIVEAHEARKVARDLARKAEQEYDPKTQWIFTIQDHYDEPRVTAFKRYSDLDECPSVMFIMKDGTWDVLHYGGYTSTEDKEEVMQKFEEYLRREVV